MQRLIVILLFGGVFLGALMPGRHAATSSSDNSTFSASSSSPHYVSGRSSSRYSESGSQGSSRVDAGSGVITLERASDGHFYAEAQVNGAPVHFLIDTGATGIALSHEDAQRASVPMSQSMDQIVGRGASGDVYGQFVTLDRVSLGLKEVRGAQAAVLEGGEESLLGQSFLSEFGSVSIEGDRMVLR